MCLLRLKNINNYNQKTVTKVFIFLLSYLQNIHKRNALLCEITVGIYIRIHILTADLFVLYIIYIGKHEFKSILPFYTLYI